MFLHYRGHYELDFAVTKLGLGLALELRVWHPGGYDTGKPLPYIIP